MALICLRILWLNKTILIKFYCIESCRGPKSRKKLKVFIEELFRKEGIELGSLTYIFCNDKYLLNINKRFLNHNYYTDIITFSFSNANENVIGELYISSVRVLENSKILKVNFEEELLRVIFHGALHLIGYNDKTSYQKKLMRKTEEKYLKYYKKLVSRET